MGDWSLRWFKHFSDASDDEFLAELEEIFGLEGYARWWKLIEAVAAQSGKTGKCSASYSWKKWQQILRGKRNKLETFLKHLENKSRINQKLSGNILEIEIPKLLELKDNYTKDLQATGNSVRASTSTSTSPSREDVDTTRSTSGTDGKPDDEGMELQEVSTW